MEPRKTPISVSKNNLLDKLDFILHLKFEARYAQSIRGGHFPLYISARYKKRLVTSVNLLTERDLKDLILKFNILPN